MKKVLMMLSAVFVTAAMTVPASAQGIGGRVERTQAEIAMEKAETDFAKMKTVREESKTKCAAREYQACYELAELERKGLGGPQDLSAAAKNYKKVCDAKDGRGCAGLAYLTVQGRGVSANLTEGRRLYKASCDLGEVSGCAAWGNMAFTGTGGAKDVQGGTRALQEACQKDYAWACERIQALGAFDPNDASQQRLRQIERKGGN
jgi:TPR repeat protein